MKNDSSQENEQYAVFGIRTAATAIDSFALSCVFFTYVILLACIHLIFESDVFLTILGYTAVPIVIFGILIYFSVFNSRGRNTLGKRMLRIHTTDYDGPDLTILQSTYRTIWYFFDTVLLNVGNFLSLFTHQKQAMHDMVSRSFVRRRNSAFIGKI